MERKPDISCFPYGCLLPLAIKEALAEDHNTALEKAGLDRLARIRGALLGADDEYEYKMVTEIVCRTCYTLDCPHYKRAKPT